MGMVVNNNIPALFSFNAVTKTGNALQKSIQKLSTGLRINSAADDAAGLAISEKMRAQIRGLDRAVANSQDGISMIQTAEGALSEVHSILQRMRELSVQAANDTLTQQDRQYIQLEIDQLKSEIDRTSTATQFNKKRLLDGSSAGLWSSNDLATKAYIRGSLRQIDRFGQKAAFEGNYKIQINANPGQAEAIAWALRALLEQRFDGESTLRTCLTDLEALLDDEGLDALQDVGARPAFLVRPRTVDVAAAVNRYRRLELA